MGDQLTAIAIKNPVYHKIFMPLCPTYAFIDRATGKFNNAMSFKKDYIALIASAWDIDQAYDDYLKYPDESTYSACEELGLLEDDGNYMEERKILIDKLMDDNISSKYKARFGID